MAACQIKFMVFCIAVFSAWIIQAQPNRGIYYYHNYTPKDYKSNDFGSSPQNWGITQDHRGVMYFCNTSGILEFDGISWNMVSGTEGLDMLKAACGADGKIYTGGIGEFGYLGRSEKEGIQFRSLTHLLPDSFPDFGRVMMVKAFRDSIAFLSPSHQFIYHDNQLTIHSTRDRYMRVLNYEGKMIIQLNQAGLCAFNSGELISLHENKMPNGRIVRHILGPTDQPVLACNRNGFLQIDKGELRYHQSMLDTVTLWNGNRLRNDIHVIGTTELGAVIIDDECQLQEVFHSDYDLSGYSVVSPFFDNKDQLWLATANGIRRIEYPARLKYYDEESGIRGIPLCIDESDQGLIIGTTQGLFNQNKTTGRFEKEPIEILSNADEFVTDIINIKNDKLILTIHGLFQKNGAVLERITDIGGFDLEIVDSSDPQVVYGGEDGVVKLSKSEGKWQKDLTIRDLEHDILSVTAIGYQRLWVSMFSISKIDLTESGPIITTLDSTHGFIPEMGPTWSFQYRDKAFFCTPVGLYSWNEKEEKLERDDLFGAEFSVGSMSNPIVLGDSAIWLYHGHQGIGRFDLRTKEFFERDLRRLDYSDVWRIQPTNEGHIWILTTEAIIRYDPTIDSSYQGGFNVLIRGVTTGEDSLLFDGYFSSDIDAPMLTQPDSMQPSLDYHHNQVTIKYAAAYYNAPEQTTYSTFLEGQDANWSQWSNKPFKEYMNLKEGRYHFKVKARNVYGNESSEALYSFSVQPPWYRTFWAYLFYLICAGFGVWGIAVLYSLRLRRQKNQLEGLVVDRTREIAEEKQKSDNLLLNILPEATATELKNQGFATSRSYDKVSVLFTDFVSFTSISETMTAEELVREIDVCFSAFDAIIEREGIEKIKTIGDAYMCAAGLDPVLSDPEIRIVRAGLAIRDFISQHNAERSKLNLPFFQIRIGIHTGRIVAGVVGKKKFAFDIWGDTVNIASRIESSSEPDCINVSATTYEFIKNHFECDHRGMIEAKNKGKLEMYFVRGILEKQIEKSDS